MTKLRKAFHDQGRACTTLGSPFMGRLFDILAAHWPSETALAAKCAAYKGDIGPASVSLPLRIAGGLHALRLGGNQTLADVYPPNTATDEELRNALLAVLKAEDSFLSDWINSPPQTNELRRSAALIPGAHVLATRFDLPIWLSELGASGGLNLMWDRFALDLSGLRLGPDEAVVTLTPNWTGPLPPKANPVIAARRGVDINPLDPTDQNDLLRLTSYLWPDQPHRLEMTRAAAGSVPAPVDRGDAIDWLDRRLKDAPEGHIHLIQNTVAWQYFPEASQARGLALLQAAGARATSSRPLAWLQLETDGDLHGAGGAALTLQIWPSGETLTLGRADFHGRWVKWLYEET